MKDLYYYYNTFCLSMQAKIKRTNVNKKDQAKNMRGVKRYINNSNDEESFNKNNTNNKIESKKKEDSKNEDEYEYEKSENLSKEVLKDFVPDCDISEYENFKFEILFENDRVLIINKAKNIMVHPDGRSKEVTISDIIYAKYPNLRNVGEWGRPGIVHRLDKNTTGALVICKTEDSYKDMKNLFREHKVRKVYRAIVEGNIRQDTGLIDKPIARSRSDFRKKAIIDMYSKDFRGEERAAITKYKVLKRSVDKKYTYVELYPLTGRTHQLRVHMMSIRHPIIGDDLYSSLRGENLADRSMLHAYKIEFSLRKEDVKVESKIPDDMQIKINELFS